jgi:predicted metal-binding transcription factor (methanogenesis marker protein 9)
MRYKKTNTKEIIEPSRIKKTTRKTVAKKVNQISATDKRRKDLKQENDVKKEAKSGSHK